MAASLQHLSSARHITSTILTLEVIAELGITAGVTSASVVILGATTSIRSAMGTQLAPAAATRREGMITTAHQRLSDDFGTAFQRGSSLAFREAADHGRELLAELRRPHGQGSSDDPPPSDARSAAPLGDDRRTAILAP